MNFTKNCADLSLFEQIVLVTYIKTFANSQPSALNSKSFSQSLEQSFLTEGKNNFAKGQLIISALPLENRSNQKENTNHYITMIR